MMNPVSDMPSIRVSEHFFSVQGEGVSVGTPAIFIRLQGCNLNCGSQSGTWTCDTLDIWKKGTKYSVVEFANIINTDYQQALDAGAHVILTGGEPLLQQAALIALIQQLPSSTSIEVETNGTLLPEKALVPYVHYWNVSPKLQNSGEAACDRLKMDVLEWFAAQPHTIFKFVVNAASDIKEVKTSFPFVSQLPLRQKFLMPAADTQGTLHKEYKTVIELAKTHGFCLSQRLHLSVWDKTTGV
jgi:7-carboxy-7-deazaguanine synthase